MHFNLRPYRYRISIWMGMKLNDQMMSAYILKRDEYVK